jgi:peptide/nickel transport system substrate-binding protein
MRLKGEKLRKHRKYMRVWSLCVASLVFVAGWTSTSAASTSAARKPNLKATVRIAVPGGPALPGVTDLIGVVGANALSFMVPLYDRLVTQDANAALKPQLASKWAYSNGDKTLTLTIRSGATFHDGTAIDAQAVVANIERTRTANNAFIPASVKNIASLAAPNSTTVVITLANADPNLLLALTSPTMGIASPAAFANLRSKPVGSGPFELVSFTPALATYKRFENYWDKSSRVSAKLEIHNFADFAVGANGLRTGAFDVFIPQPSLYQDIKDFQDDSGFQVLISRTAAQVSGLWLNREAGPLANPDVRRALNYAIDRKAIGAVTCGGLCVPNDRPIVTEGPKAKVTTYKYDPARAKKMLADAGYPNGIRISVLHPPAVGSLSQVIPTIIQNQARPAGITVDLRPSQGALFQEWQSGAFDAIYLAPPGSQDSAGFLTDWYGGQYTKGKLPADQAALVEAVKTTQFGTPERGKALEAFNRDQLATPSQAIVLAIPLMWASTSKVIGLDQMPYMGSGANYFVDFSRLRIAK